VKVAADPVVNGRRVILQFAEDRKNNNRSLLCCYIYCVSVYLKLCKKIVIVNCADEYTILLLIKGFISLRMFLLADRNINYVYKVCFL